MTELIINSFIFSMLFSEQPKKMLDSFEATGISKHIVQSLETAVQEMKPLK